MRRTRDRVLILVIVGAFLLTTVGVSIATIWQIMEEGKQNKAAETSTQAQTNQTNDNALKGTNMQDFTPVAKIDELSTQDLEPGNGQEVKAGDTVTVDYTGAVAATGKVFESSLDSGQPVTFGLDQVIKGWSEGLVGMKEGGKRRLLIPADKAYGAQSPSPDIPANADLVFDVTLRSIQKK